MYDCSTKTANKQANPNDKAAKMQANRSKENMLVNALKLVLISDLCSLSNCSYMEYLVDNMVVIVKPIE